MRRLRECISHGVSLKMIQREFSRSSANKWELKISDGLLY